MAIPALPTVTSIVTQGLKRSGRVNPTVDQITEATDHALQEVKADIMLVASTHPNLMATATTFTTRGQQRYTTPSDSNEQISISILDGPEDWRGIAQAATILTITLASTLAVVAEDIVGKYILITGGPGAQQYREILDYDPTTKIATIDSVWTSTPTNGSTYILVQRYNQLWPNSIKTDFDRIHDTTVLGTPTQVAIFEQEFNLYPVPDKIYGLLNRYWVDLSRVDEAGAVFVQCLREWRALWIQGVAVKSMQRFDEDRYTREMDIYSKMLLGLSNQTCQVGEVQYRDL